MIAEKHKLPSLFLFPCYRNFFCPLALLLTQQHRSGYFRGGSDAGREEIVKKDDAVISTSIVMLIFLGSLLVGLN